MVQSISSLQELLDELPSCCGKDYVNITKGMTIPVSDFEPYIFFSDKTYTRNCIVRTEKYELILLCWDKGQITPIHCHGGEECWVYALQGDLEEYRYTEDQNGHPQKDHTMILKEGRISYMNDEMGYHSLNNISEGKAMSLHLYMNPIDTCRVYNEDTSSFDVKNLKYYSLEGKVLE